ncbi:hypothetical protein [Periweissella fabalis]|uniref:Uncharacterized protein n=1 Tax=Periweissella fabalis TaxID=1070421 RepID=A0A7X6N2X2_9LACO|nr:hypothetical protein [Periweissella fabalis]MCM0598158.1 hypothetical protein [Periweissella fabalis]NKZ24718.1 hypothetical protein [Periweissella fabalis]
MQRKWVLTILTVIDFATVILMINPLIDVFKNGLQSDSALKTGLIIVITGLINLTYVRN